MTPPRDDFLLCDVFADAPFRGNTAAVVLLDEAQWALHELRAVTILRGRLQR